MKAPSFIKRFSASVLCLSLLCSFTSIYAIEGQFEISLTVGGDLIAPSVPTGLSASAVSGSQINLSWTASTDNVSVLAYRIYRDSLFVATSSVTTYSDIGLNPNTLYSYTVSAVDTSYNESAQSLPASATTFPLSSPPSSGGGSTLPVIFNLQVTPTTSGAIVYWETSQPTQTLFSWGKTNDYELGNSAGLLFSTTHSINLSGLNSATLYQFQITATNAYGISSTASGLSFTTLWLATGKENVRNFVAQARDSHIDLSWQNPTDPSFSEVRVVRREGYFPTDSADGEVVYEGGAEFFRDEDVERGIRYYYAIFAKYSDGEMSSGSLASARIVVPGEVVEPFDPFDSLPKAKGVHPIIQNLSLIDFDFIQRGQVLSFFGNETVAINGDQRLTVSLDYEKVPEILKTILITLSHPDNPEQIFSFLLRVNEEKTAYSATIAPLGKSGLYGVEIAIVDYQNRGLKKIVGNLLATAEIGFGQSDSFFPGAVILLKKNWINLLILLLIAYCIYRVLKKRKEKLMDKRPVVKKFS